VFANCAKTSNSSVATAAQWQQGANGPGSAPRFPPLVLLRSSRAGGIHPTQGYPQSQSRAALPWNCKGGEKHHHQRRPFRGILVCADTGPNRERRRCLLTGTFRSNGVVPDDRSRNCGPETPRLSGGQKHSPDCNHQTRPEPPASFERIGHTPGQRQRNPAGKARRALHAASCEEWGGFYARHGRHA
jgi:hypothetical protein